MEWFDAKTNPPRHQGKYLVVISYPEIKGNDVFYYNCYDLVLYSPSFGWCGVGNCPVLKWTELPDPDEVVNAL